MSAIYAPRTARRGRLALWLLSAGIAAGLVPIRGLVGAALASGDEHGEEHEGEHGDEHEGEEEHEEGVVRLTEKQLEHAGLRVQKVGPGPFATGLRLTAIVEENLDALAHVTPRSPGLVRAIFHGLGDRVKENEPLCEIDSIPLGNAVSEHLQAKALLVASRAMLAQETVLLSRGVEISQQIYEREKALRAKEISTLRPLYEAERALSVARLERQSRILELERELGQQEIRLRATQARLRVLALSEKEIAALTSDSPAASGRYTVRAPLGGVIAVRHVSLHEYVATDRELYRILDLRRAWVVASVYEKDLARVKLGQTAKVQLEAFPGTWFSGKVTVIGYELERRTRAIPVRIELENERIAAWSEELPIRPGMFGVVDLVTREHPAAVVLPEAAIVHEGERSYVFVQRSEREFERRAIRYGEGMGGLVEVLDGLEAGEVVCVQGTFTLKSLARAGELGEGHSH